MRLARHLAGTLLLGLVPAAACAQSSDSLRLQRETLARAQEYLRINTVNPPGNESATVDWFKRIFDAEGIHYETAESAPGRGNIRAVLDGGPEPALILLHHMDVVPADARFWVVDPLSATIRDGMLYGRGALDTKTLGIFQLEAFLELHRAGRPLRRPVIFMATADEEAGGNFGVGWLVRNRPAWFQGAGLLLNEGGSGSQSGNKQVFEIEVTQKVPLWLRLTAHGEPGHGSMPRVETAVTRLLRALDNLRRYQFEPRIVPAVESYFRGRAAAGIGPFADRIGNIRQAIDDTAFLTRLQAASPFLAALTRNTCSITRLEGSSKINVIPPEASAELDCRLLPDQDATRFITTLQGVLADTTIHVEKIMGFTAAVSTTDTDLYRTLERITQERFPAAAVLPSVQTGFTDSHFLRDLGIVCYGYSPIVIPASDESGVHGNNERISLENVRRGVLIMSEVLKAVAW